MNMVLVMYGDLVGHPTGPPLSKVQLGQGTLWAVQQVRLYKECD
jgi:hypothetical protein